MVEYSLKVKCVKAAESMTAREVFEQVFLPEYGEAYAYESFKRRLREWKRRRMADDDTLCCGTYPNFTAHNATVQVDSKGRITRAWIKQQHDMLDWIKLREFLSEEVRQSDIAPSSIPGDRMLEIPLFDMHFGIADYEYYKAELSEIVGIISDRHYDEINILFGQDVLHNNDMRGHTAKGTDIEKVSFTQAWADCWKFFMVLIDAALHQSRRVVMRYSKGNHDECSAWCMFKCLEAAYPQVEFDDSLAPRKCISWRGCFIGFGHCEYTPKTSVLFQNFVMDFPAEFAAAKVREIHSGHLHRESCDDGIMVRRLPSAVPTDEWSSNNGYVGAHKRFQIFEWAENRLKSIHYV